MQTIQADYVIVGSGAMGMAFADVLFHETSASIAFVDKHHQPGGHWNDAYGYVRLHQPSAFYGVNSAPLGSDQIDQVGWNKGLYELATNGEVCAYFDSVMQQQFLPSGRVQYLPMSEYTGNNTCRSLVSDEQFQLQAGTLVDATYMNVTVPAMREPAYAVAAGVHCEPPNALPRLCGAYRRYTVIGAGKTGMDACLFLLKSGVDPDHIAWVMPRDSWILDRANIQPGHLFAQSIGRAFALQAEVLANANSISDLFQQIAHTGQLLRLDENVEPSMYRCATVTRDELEALRRIKQVLRKGRVQRITQDTLVLDEGSVPTDTHTLHIDCSADGLEKRAQVPVFDDGKITLQSVRTCQQVFSAAFIGHIEASGRATALKNELCQPVPHPDTALDFLRTNLQTSANAARWSQEPELSDWLKAARLDGFTSADMPDPDPTDPAFKTLLANQKRASENVQRLLREAVL